MSQLNAFTISKGGTRDLYDFGQRGAFASKMKIIKGYSSEEPLNAPWTLEVEPTLLCNADCSFCSYGEDIAKAKLNRYIKGLPREAVLNALRTAGEAGTKGILWSGGGEPLLWPHIDEALTLSASLAEVSVQTNGIKLDAFTKTIDSLGRFRIISVSVVGHTPELHLAIMRVKSFARIIRNIEHVAELKLRGVNTLLTAKILVSVENHLLLPEIVQFYLGLGVDAVALRIVQDYNYGGDGQRPTSLDLSQSQRHAMLQAITTSSFQHDSLLAFAETLTQQIIAPPVTSRCYNATDGHFACIDAHGDVFIGNPEIGNPEFCIGNILVSPWEEIWRSERHLTVIQKMNAMQCADTCQRELCRHVKANLGVQNAIDNQWRDDLDGKNIMQNLGAFL